MRNKENLEILSHTIEIEQCNSVEWLTYTHDRDLISINMATQISTKITVKLKSYIGRDTT